MFQQIAVVNRGEAAVRLIRAVRELNAEHNYGIKTVALHTDAERRAMFVRQADEAITLRSDGPTSPYLDHSELERALRLSGAEAVWVGWGFVAEDPAFAELCESLGITLIGPSAEAMRRLGDKVSAKVLAEEVGVPVAPWSGGPVESLADARRHAQNIGYPLIIKARSGGGGRGIRKVNSAAELETAFERTQGEALRSFGDPVVFLERLVTEARHVEVQVVADSHGNVWAPGVRDCSIQRRNQKLVEESSSPLLTAEQSAHLREASARLVLAAGYLGAATVEYLYQPDQQVFTFLEVNTRLQVEHPITEATTGLDLVKLQLQVAAGEALPADMPQAAGHAIEARLNAEDADNDFAAAPGTVRRLNLPMGPGIRVDTGIGQGDVIPPEYDSMVAKIIAWGPDRSVALARLRTALRETTVVIEGGTTTKSFLLSLLNREEVISASADTGWLDRTGVKNVQAPSTKADTALLATAVEVYEAEEALERSRFLASARGGRPRADDSIGRTVELSYQEQAYTFAVEMTGPHRFRISSETGSVLVTVENLAEFERRVATSRGTSRVVSIETAGGHLVEVDGVPHRITRDEGGLVRAPSPSVVMAVPVSVGDEVEVGDTLMVLEAMKTEAIVRAPQAGQIREVLAGVNTQVDAGASLIRLESAEEQTAGDSAPRVEFDTEPSQPGAPESSAAALEQLDVLRALITGYDVTAARAREVFADYERASAHRTQEDPELLKAELAMLTTFADLCELARNRPTLGEQDLDTRVHSPREFFHSYLHSLDPEREGLPQTFQDRLIRALKHFNVTGLEHTAELEQAVYRVFLAQQRIENQIPVIVGLLEHWLEDRRSLDQVPEELEEVLDRVVVATQARYPLVGDVARSLRYSIFEEPRIRATREEVYDRARGSVAYLAENPGAADREERIESLIAGPEPLLDLLARSIAKRLPGTGELLEVVTRRYYKIRPLAQMQSYTVGERPVVTGTFELSGAQLDLISTVGDATGLSTILDEIESVAAKTTGELVLDLYLSWVNHPDGPDAMSTVVHQELVNTSWLHNCRRVTVTIGDEQQAMHRFTFRPIRGQLTEERVIRDMHPLQGQRLELWRFKNFDGTRLPAAPDTYLFHLVGKENPADERVVALAEIRDVVPARDDDGNVVGMPMAERTLAACLDGIRRARTQHSSLRRLTANRVVLYAWPVLDLPLHQVADTAARNIAPLTVDMGLEEISLIVRVRQQGDEQPREVVLRYSFEADGGITTQLSEPSTEPLEPMDDYTQKVRKSRLRGTVYPYEIIPLLTGEKGSFTEHDLDESGRLVPVDRPYGQNSAAIIVGVVNTPTTRYPEGMRRVALFGDPTKALGSLAEPECARVVAALDLAERLQAPVEWFALSAGAQISMERGTENMDWVSRALRRLVTFTQDGGEVNIVVAGINVGAQPYWNAEATMLMHTRGILVMTPNSAMVLTGKHSLDFAGGVSAEDNFGIGGYDRVMGPNGQAQYWAPHLTAAVDVLTAHYDHTYTAPGERFPRPADTADPTERNVCIYPHTHPASDFTTVGDIFSDQANPDRKKPYDIRTVMRAVVDQDLKVLERWADMADADTSVVFDAHLGGFPVCLIGIESRPVARTGQRPTDGPDQWTPATLFPRSSKKTARAINATSGNRPLVVLANLSGFDGSPESMRNQQLEFGAEIGRAIVNFQGPIIFCVVTRYHGGAFVVFSGKLNDTMEIAAVEGSYASVLGGSSAAAVVFTRDVNARTSADPRVRELQAAAAQASEADRAGLQVQLRELRASVRGEKLSEVASEFDSTHSIERAQSVGSVDSIVAPDQLRPYLVDAVRRGLQKSDAAPQA